MPIFLVTTEPGCIADNGDQCIFPFRRPDGTIDKTTCHNGGCAIRLTEDGKMQEAGACMPGCLGGIFLFMFVWVNSCIF